MLIEVEGTAPFEEDSWVGGPVRIGQVLVSVTHALERCVVINHHPRTGAKDWPGLKTLVARGRESADPEGYRPGRSDRRHPRRGSR